MATDNGLVRDLTVAEPVDFGVLSGAATVIRDYDSDWSRGIDFETVNCRSHVRLNAICSTASGADVVPADSDALYMRYLPFDIEADFACSTFGFGFLDYEGTAREYLRLAEQKAIEYELWTGVLAKQQQAVWVSGNHNGESFPNRWLASSAAVDVTPTPGTAVKAKYGLALLEDAIGDCGVGIKGTIHATRGVASALNLKSNGGKLVTSLGNNVIAGSGYTGSGPDGTMPTGTKVWAYATGPVSVRIGPAAATPGNRNQSVNVANNSVQVYASEPAAVSWDSCCHYAVLIDLALDYA